MASMIMSKAQSAGFDGRGREGALAYGFVKMMSDAPSVQRVRCECR